MKRLKKEKRESGLLSLEACISVTIFIFLMLFMYSFFVVFEVRNEIGHTLLSTANSLSLDPFVNETMGDDDSLKGIIYGLYGACAETNGTYTETSKWYEDSAKVQQTVKNRFLAYMAGGSQSEANKIAKQLNIVGGFDGLDFSKSKVENGNLTLVVEYRLEYEFQVFQLDRLQFRQTCTSRLWK